jgi:hypothetical protein
MKPVEDGRGQSALHEEEKRGKAVPLHAMEALGGGEEV